MKNDRWSLFSLLLTPSLIACLLLDACSSGGLSGSPPIPTQAALRIVNGTAYGLSSSSPGSANRVDVYIYTVGTARPTQPAFSGVQYFNISPYQSFAPGSYQVDVFDHGSTQSMPILNETVAVTSQNNFTVVVAGERAGVFGNSPYTLQLVNFVEPVEVQGQTAVVFHQAAPYYPTIGVGVIPPSQSPFSLIGSIPQLFVLGLQTTSGPATAGNGSGGEYWVATANLTPPTTAFGLGGPGNGGAPQPSLQVNARTGAASQGTRVSLFVIDDPAPDNQSIVGVISATDP